MANLHVIKASAGSGKTYTLTEEYLKLILNGNLEGFKHILAVTFTNKATAEMKSRIIEKLHILSNSPDKDYLNNIAKATGLSPNGVQYKSREVLDRIMHAYSFFKIETIDSFFQNIIRSFANEINLISNFSLELDTNAILENAVDRLLDKLSEDKELLNWSYGFIQDTIESGSSWNLKNQLLALGKEVFKEEYSKRTHNESIESFLKYKAKYSQKLKQQKNELISIGKDFLKKANENDLTPKDFFQGARGIYGLFQKLATFSKWSDINLTSTYLLKPLNDIENWTPAKSPNKDLVKSLATAEWQTNLQRAIELLPAYFNTQSYIDNIYAHALIKKNKKEIDILKDENKLFLISDSAPLIYKIIDNNDSPFIYEKIGNYFNHFMIDEFQDTSALQWENFKPLLSNSLSNNNDCLVVGDVKQSIYRWRNGDWRVLGNINNGNFKNVIKERNLDTNWRSQENIINFNNDLFTYLSTLFNEHLATTDVNLEQLYADVNQQTPEINKAEGGYVHLEFIDNKVAKDDKDYWKNWLYKQVNYLFQHNFGQRDIVILVRSKHDGKKIANALIEANKTRGLSREVKVISNDSLFISASPAVRLCIAYLQYLRNPHDLIALTVLVKEYLSLQQSNNQTISLPDYELNQNSLIQILPQSFTEFQKKTRHLNLFEIASEIFRFFHLYMETELVYIHAFLDLVHDYSQKNSSDINTFLDYWDNTGSGKSISVSEDTNAIQIMTIHKSKGLQFPAVIMPFCDWDIKPKSGTIIWHTLDNDELENVPVSIKKDLINTDFKDVYLKEYYNNHIDNLNMLYVAYTRAEKALFSLSKISPNNFGSLIKNAALQINPEIEDKLCIGSLEAINKQAPVTEHSFKTKKFTPISTPIKLSTFHKIKQPDEEEQEDLREEGILWHNILGSIETFNDVNETIESYYLNGLIDSGKKEILKENISNLLNNELARDWFSGTYSVINEADILIPKGNIKRPDRVLIKGTEAIIIDYKLGSQDAFSKHAKQIINYKSLFREMGYAHVTGYLWYMRENEIKEVV